MKMFFKTRTQMRNFKSGKAVDMGSQSKQGRRWARDLSKK